MNRVMAIIMMLLIACNSTEQSDKSHSTQQAASAEAQDQTETSPEKAEEQTNQSACELADIPTWNGQMASLTERRCERCHNASFAWEGVQLHTYEKFKENAQLSLERLAKGDLSFEIAFYEVELFEKWINAGLPKSGADCAN